MEKEKDLALVIGGNIANRRKELGFTQAYMARVLQTNQARFSEYEQGKIVPRADTLKRIADVLNTTAGALMGEAENLKVKETLPEFLTEVKVQGVIYEGNAKLEKNFKLEPYYVVNTNLVKKSYENNYVIFYYCSKKDTFCRKNKYLLFKKFIKYETPDSGDTVLIEYEGEYYLRKILVPPVGSGYKFLIDNNLNIQQLGNREFRLIGKLIYEF